MPQTRRSFVRLAGASLLTGGMLPAPWVAAAQPRADLPKLDGEVLFDEAARSLAGGDIGTGMRRAPLAVVRPRSVDDVARIVAHANRTGLKVAMRGQAHSLYGQAQADGGVVID